MRVNIIGGGLAGCSLAYILKQKGVEPVIYEASCELASGASGNAVGLYNPRFAAQMDAPSEFYSTAFWAALEVFKEFGDLVDWNPCGVLKLLTDERSIKRFHKTAVSWGWSEDDMRIVSPEEASGIAGIEIPYEALYTSKSGNISPKKLCGEYARGVEVHLNTKIEGLNALDGEVTVLACGMGCLNFEEAKDLPFKAVRGQVSYIKQTEQTKGLKVALSYSGHFAPARDGVHCLGSTFQPWLDHDELIEEDNLTNLDKLFEVLPYLKGAYEVVDSKAGVRTTSKDHFPVVGQLQNGENLYISAAHGSYGIITSLLSAKIIADKIMNGHGVMQQDVLNALSPYRFKKKNP